MKKTFHIHALSMTISAEDEFPAGVELVHRIAEDFSFFEREQALSPPRLTFEIRRSRGSRESRLLPAFRTRMCRCFGWRRERLCDYGEGTRVHSWFDGGRRIFQVEAGETELAYEALYSAVLSAVGEELDWLGYHRVHALGLEIGQERALLILPTGGGKSAIAALLLKQGARIFSDESPLIRAGRIYPFPVRGALHPEVAQALSIETSGRVFQRKLFPAKVLFEFPAHSVAQPGPLTRIFFPEAQASGTGRFRGLWVLFKSCVIGLGLAQMSEYMIRLDSVYRLPIIALRRLVTCIGLVRRARCSVILLDSNARNGAATLLHMLGK